jgi:hypothetical protein
MSTYEFPTERIDAALLESLVLDGVGTVEALVVA